MALKEFIPDAADALGAARVFPTFIEEDFAAHSPSFATAKFVAKPMCDEMLAIIQAVGSGIPPALIKTADYTLVLANHNRTITNQGSSGTVTILNPGTLNDGFVIHFVNVSGDTLIFDAGGDFIMRGEEEALTLELTAEGHSAGLRYIGGFWSVDYLNGGGLTI
jgi:hypothetical protein